MTVTGFIGAVYMFPLRAIIRASVALGIHPNVLTLIGVLINVAAAWALGRNRFLLAGVIMIIANIFDFIDGKVAYITNTVSRFGAFWDSTLDRFAETFTFLGLAHYYSHNTWATMAIALALGASLLVSYTRARGESVGVSQKGGLMQRAERLVLLALGALLDGAVTSAAGWERGTLLAAVAAVIGVGAMGTAIYRTVTIASELRRR